MEAEQLRHALESSLLDFAISVKQASCGGNKQSAPLSPAQILGVEEGCSPQEVKAAYRRKVLKAHPDKGGSVTAFLQLQRAYRKLTLEPESDERPEDRLAGCGSAALPAPERIQNHRAIVHQWFERDGVDVAQLVARLENATEALGLQVVDMGSTNRNERGEVMHNQVSPLRTYLCCIL